MEITLEKIELVKDRTGVSYKEAKEALEAADGNVVDAIVAIEEQINASAGAKLSDHGEKVISQIKELIRKGNIARILIKREDEIILNLPVTVGVVGTVLAPWLTVIGAVVALGTRCKIELIKDDGEIIDVSGKAEETFEGVREKGEDAFDAVRNKAGDAVNKAKDVTGKAKSDAAEIKDIVKDAAQEIKGKVKKEEPDAPEEPAESASEAEADENAGKTKGKTEK
ncbi:MAG: DUF4342 domain-containing protein [Clostridiales Family XIII bacterium]|jgi:hypothetical protein|nr:DUF4342 domain-containing protein [Clostridiales Family XIII bacterium]